MRVKLVIADDHELVRSGLRALLRSIDELDVVAEARDGHELLTIVDSLQPDVVMTDLSMPRLNGLDAVAQIARRFPQIKVLVLSMHNDIEFVRRAIAQGACGYLTKDAQPCELEHALRRVMKSGSYFSPELARRLFDRSDPAAEDELTFRQRQILTLLAQGKSSKEVAFELGLSPKTVDVHRGNIMARLNLREIASLTRYAVRKGLIKL